MGEAVMDGSKQKFNIFKLLNLDAMVDFQAGVADRVFGIFANLDKHIFNLLGVYFFWSMGIFSIRTIFEVVKIIQNDCFAPFKIITALFEPIVFLILFPFFADWKKEREREPVMSRKLFQSVFNFQLLYSQKMNRQLKA
jgi:hypothetical protein